MGTNRSVREVERLARELGWDVSPTPGGHLKLTKPGCQPVYTASTPSDHRGIKNLRARLRRFDRD